MSGRLFLDVEHGIYIVLGIVLSLTAIMALINAIGLFWHSAVEQGGGDSLLEIVDRLLFVLMMAEILHTVRVSINSGSLTAQPFLVVGLIASIRRVLVITLESSQTGNQPPAEHHAAFQAAMIELGVLCALILVMVTSIYLLQRAARMTRN
ncbi:MAG TPA: phosphate-starvation-inducible PsiE family protein [Rhodopila sp.]|nr:phosphate-starvation-inducible PsiE family protein [Rhodopila sp.]